VRPVSAAQERFLSTYCSACGHSVKSHADGVCRSCAKLYPLGGRHEYENTRRGYQDQHLAKR
jgi:hypothetical protein